MTAIYSSFKGKEVNERSAHELHFNRQFLTEGGRGNEKNKWYLVYKSSFDCPWRPLNTVFVHGCFAQCSVRFLRSKIPSFSSTVFPFEKRLLERSADFSVILKGVYSCGLDMFFFQTSMRPFIIALVALLLTVTQTTIAGIPSMPSGKYDICVRFGIWSGLTILLALM